MRLVAFNLVAALLLVCTGAKPPAPADVPIPQPDLTPADVALNPETPEAEPQAELAQQPAPLLAAYVNLDLRKLEAGPEGGTDQTAREEPAGKPLFGRAVPRRTVVRVEN